MSLFITLEGGEGSGKSEQAMALYRRLYRMDISSVLTREPGVTPLGRRIAYLLKWQQKVLISPMAEVMLFNASRAQLLTELIRPSLADGKVVICDRYYDSTLAYQGYGRGLDLEAVRAVNGAGTLGLAPDVTILLDIDCEAGFARKKGKRIDRFEQETMDFHRRVRQGFLEMAKAEPERWIVVDASQTRARVSRDIWLKVAPLFDRNNGINNKRK
ncbi:dTMP kinase [Chloroflexota bacterium]